MVPYYRSVASLITFGMTPREIMLAQFARAVDPSSGGRQMPGHYGVADRQIVSVSSPVATQVLHATGIALAAKLRKTGQVAITYTGEGSSNQGDFFEALNFAGIHKLPVVFVVENNGYAISVPMSLQSAVPDIAMRAAGFGMPGVVVDGFDFFAVHEVAGEAIARARAGGGPTLIECKVGRYFGHFEGDQQTYRAPHEVEDLRRDRDCLNAFARRVTDAGLIEQSELAAIDSSVAALIEEAVIEAKAAPYPTAADVLTDVYVSY
jgi:TPP-dependent pyruvate/acetoin dehydrogenase alpha subunit